MLKNIIRKVLPYSLIQSIKIELAFFKNTPPIIVYQMGKVGSNTVKNTLKHTGLPNPVYSVHFLTNEGLKRYEQDYIATTNGVPIYIKAGKILRNKIAQNPGRQWKIITLTREPIGRDISALFQTMERKLPEEIDENGQIKKVSNIMETLQNKFANYDESSDYACTWFNRELKRRFDIDIYAYPFDPEKGFTIIRKGNVEVLVIRVEDLNRCLSEAIKKFLNFQIKINVSNKNIGEEKNYSNDYRYIKDTITIPKAVCEKIYASKYATHFYGDRVNKLVRKWSQRETAKNVSLT